MSGEGPEYETLAGSGGNVLIDDLKRRINLRLGVTRADDVLPPRLLTCPHPSGSAQGILPDLEPMLAAYYQLRDWDAEGRPRGGNTETRRI